MMRWTVVHGGRSSEGFILKELVFFKGPVWQEGAAETH